MNVINESNNRVITNTGFALLLRQALFLVFHMSYVTQSSCPFCEVDAVISSPFRDSAARMQKSSVRDAGSPGRGGAGLRVLASVLSAHGTTLLLRLDTSVVLLEEMGVF